jgi:hypothetical protein
MPARTDIEKRDRAIIAFTLLAGARDDATASFKLKHIDLAVGKIDQDAREGSGGRELDVDCGDVSPR